MLFDTAPTALLSYLRRPLPARYAKALQRYRFGPGVAKVDFVLSGEIPWRDPRLAEAPTLHMGGNREQMALAESARSPTGRHPEWPMVLAALPHLADPSRIDAQGRRPLWTYAHVPSRFAGRPEPRPSPGFSSASRPASATRGGVRSVPAARLADHNANLVGGDIGVGGNNDVHALAGPTLRLNPWATPIPKAYLCSSADAAGRRRARHVRLLRRAHRAAPRVRHQEPA